jgi:hypothetical protein
MALGMHCKNEPGNVKGTDGKSNFVLGEKDKETFLKTTI